MKVTNISQKGLELIKRFEGFESKPYADLGGVWTIGYGSTYYESGAKVRSSDLPISEARATELLLNVVKQFEHAVDSYTRDDVSQSQFDALVCFAYNIGSQALKKSTLLKFVNTNPNDPNIAAQFLRWNKVEGKAVKGLTNRRKAESQLYFS